MSFLNPLFLLGLAAIAAPIVVHLVRRTKATRVEFPSLMFVRKVPQRTIRRRQFTNLLLLLMRCLAFLLLVLAFVRPYFSSGQASDAGKERANVLLFDGSFSMRYGNRFEQARKRAATIIDDTRGNERTALAVFGQGFDVQEKFTTDASKLKAALARLQPGWGATDYSQALRAAEALFKDAPAKEKRIILVSDFQASGRNAVETPHRLGKDIKLITIDVGEEAAPNLAIADANLQPLIYQAKYADKLTARVANYSDEAKTGVRVEFQLNDHTVEKREIKIEARDAATVEFTGFNLNEGVNRGVLSVEGDNFPADNKFYFTMRRAPQMKALVIETAGRGRSESFYLRSALTAGENLPFTLEVKTAGAVNPNDLSQFRVILVNDAAVSPALGQSLVKFVESGGGLILSTGPHTEAAAFNQAFASLPIGKLGETVSLRGDFATLSDIKTDHPIFEIFRESGRLALAHVFSFRKSTPGEKAAVLARYDDGTPALLEAAHGAGKALLYTTTLDSVWNDLPLTPTYLPFVRQMTRYLGEPRVSAWNPLGQVFTVAAARDGAPPAVDAPGGERITDRKQTPNGDLIVPAREPGFYRLRYPDASDFAAVNLDARESDFARLNVEEFVAAVTGADARANAAAAAGEKPSNEELESRERWWLWLLLGSLLLFVTEAVLARRMKMAKMIG